MKAGASPRLLYDEAAEFAEIISRLRPNPHCQICGGRKGWYAIRKVHNHLELAICCGQPGETEYARTMKKLDELVHDVDVLEHRMNDWGEVIYAHTFFGAIRTLWARLTMRAVDRMKHAADISQGDAE